MAFIKKFVKFCSVIVILTIIAFLLLLNHTSLLAITIMNDTGKDISKLELACSGEHSHTTIFIKPKFAPNLFGNQTVYLEPNMSGTNCDVVAYYSNGKIMSLKTPVLFFGSHKLKIKGNKKGSV